MNEIRKQLGPMADSYTRDVLDLKTLELCTVAALTVQGFSLPELKLHIDAALRSGASREEVIEVIIQMIAYVGFPAATNALMTAQAVFEDRDATKEAKQAAE
jgi:4-carboxymuconolactone decarboxylase